MNENISGSKVVLVVDDSPSTVGMLNETLEKSGMTPLIALEGKQALSIAKRMTPDIILLDALMPNMDGFEVCRQLKSDQELKSIPVIFMTGLKDTEDVVKGFEVGGVDYITKPIKQAELIARIRVHLANSRLVMSAQSALDLAGQNMFATNRKGDIIWSTPQVNQLLQQFFQTQDGISRIQKSLDSWLDKTPMAGTTLRLDVITDKGSLKVNLLGKVNDDEFLLRLSSENEVGGIDKLRDTFRLTQREAQVLFWIARGKTNREIGQIIETSPRTVNKHLEQVFKKVEVENRTLAAAKALSALL